MLRLDGVRKAFGSLVVTDDVSLAIEAGERHAVIGPNGAGKTSLLNQIGGQLASSAGRILLDGHDVTGLTPEALAARGLSRTFQRNSLFPALSVLENVLLAVEMRRGHPLDFFSGVLRRPALRARAEEILGVADLRGRAMIPVANLSYGEQRQLEIAVALASEPRILLLDEPTSGMSQTETHQITDLLRTLPRSLTLILVEHDMDVVFSLADRVTVLYYGRVLASGPPAEISANAEVRRVYLGETLEDEAVAAGSALPC